MFTVRELGVLTVLQFGLPFTLMLVFYLRMACMAWKLVTYTGKRGGGGLGWGGVEWAWGAGGGRRKGELWGWLFVGWLLNVPATCECISGTDLLRQFYVLPH